MEKNLDQSFLDAVEKYRYELHKLLFVIFPFGEKGTPLEHKMPYAWQIQELKKLSDHLRNPETRYLAYYFAVTSGHGAAKTSLGAMLTIMLMYLYRVRGRVTANTDTQLRTVIWPEYDKWCNLAVHFTTLFEKQGTSIKSVNPKYAETHRVDQFTWSEDNPDAIAGLHNSGGVVLYTFEEAAKIPANIIQKAEGAFTDIDAIKIMMLFANSSDPNSYFERCMSDPKYHSKRIDTREMSHVSPEYIANLLKDCNGDEDHDDFRTKVRGLPAKSSSDAIISLANANKAINRKDVIDIKSPVPIVLTCDPAWTGGDRTTIWVHQGNVSRLLESYKLSKAGGDDHNYTYNLLRQYEKDFKVDAVLIDQAEGTGIYTLSQRHGAKYHWELISFGSSANDAPDFNQSQYQNLRAQMYYEANDWLKGPVTIQSNDVVSKDDIVKELTWTKGKRNASTLKKQARPKDEVKIEYGVSPDISDGFVLRFSRKIYDRLPQHRPDLDNEDETQDTKPYDPYKNMTFRG